MKECRLAPKAVCCFVAFCCLCLRLAAQVPMECATEGTEKQYRICNRKGTAIGYGRSVAERCVKSGDTLVVTQLEYEFDEHHSPLKDEFGNVLPPDTTRVRIVAGEVIYPYAELLGGMLGRVWNTPEQLEALRAKGQAYRYELRGDSDYRIPHDMTVGDTLSRFCQRDELYSLKKGKCIVDSSLEVITYVADREMLVTPAGRFDCFKLITVFSGESKVAFFRLRDRGAMAVWVASGIGFVRMGETDRKGRMKDGYMELLSIKTAEAPQSAQ
ncbi:hypothetical protein [uncultured Alistipes sp.]|uniref:TapB family protein n=1 Tax=Alistipes sp. TaxID=1872444 RepID=UPI00266DA49B|nr:hypothetical protein [uncultured Alistipes sp.]